MSKKKLLFVDDMSERWEALSRKLPEKDWFSYWTPNAHAAIGVLKDGTKFDVICLDHDMPRACGCTVVNWIIKHRVLFLDTKFLIHSWNPAGAKAMNDKLVEAGLKSSIKEFTINKEVL